MQDTYKRFRVPNEDIRLTAAEVEVIQTRQFQRLFNLKQLGLAYLVYPMATHTRGGHSILCVGQAGRILQAVSKADDAEAMAVRMAALLHDIGHVPFSHTLEDENLVLDRHDRPERMKKALALLRAELPSRAQGLIDEAAPILDDIAAGSGTSTWRGDLVGNTVCADLLAYITTDAAWTGIEKRPGYYRLYDYFTVYRDRLCVRLTKGGLRPDVVSAILDLLDMRYALTERVYMHHAKCVASAMLARVARLSQLSDTDDLLSIGDEGLFALLEVRARETSQGAGRVLQALQARHLYKRIFRLGTEARQRWDQGRASGAFCARWRDAGQVENLLRDVENEHRLPEGSLVLWCPEAKANMKLANVQVVWETADSALGGPVPLRDDLIKERFPGVYQRVRNIESQYADLWTFWVAIDRTVLAKAAPVVQSLEEAIGETCDSDFVETYLKQIDGYTEASKLSRRVTTKTRSLASRAQSVLGDQAARSGGSAPPPDDEQIMEAIQSVLSSDQDAQASLPLVPTGDQPDSPPRGTKTRKRPG